jgi:hypothetical protein
LTSLGAGIRASSAPLRAGTCAVLFGALLLLAQAVAPAGAFIPKASRIVSAIALANSQAGRSQALLFQLRLRMGDGDVLAEGELLTHPSGFARLELRGANDLIERHLLQGMEHTASRNGGWLLQPRPLLPPLFFVQAESGASLKAALAAFGVDSNLVGLAVCGDSDCFVVGDPRRVPARVAATPPGTPEQEQAPAVQLGEGDLAPGLASLQPKQANVWVDMRSYRIRRFELAGGVVVELGPPMLNDKIETPQWVVINEPDRAPVTLEFTQVVAVSAPARSFREDWLLTGTTEGSAPSEP